MLFEARNEIESNEQSLVAISRRATLPEVIIAPLLELLSTDDAYRARFEANPRAALRELGYETPAGREGIRELDPVMAFDYFHNGLASKEKIVAGRAGWLARVQGDERIFAPFDMCG
jgi:putative modified peptide